MKATILDARAAAVQALAEVLDERRFVGECTSFAKTGDPRNQALARHWTYGVLRWHVALEWLTSQLIERPFRRKDRDIQRLVLLGLFQLWQDNTPDHAAIHETAGCARALGKAWAVGLVNAVLRRFQRERAEWLDRLGRDDARWAHPAWLLQRLRADWPDAWEVTASAANQAPPMWLRHNRRGAPLDTVVSRLAAAGFTVTRSRHLPDAIRVDPPAAVELLPGFTEGSLSVQDPAAQLAAGLLEPAAGMNVLDACAAPGGKTTHLLETAPGIRLTAVDLQSSRLDRLTDNLRRLGLDCRVVEGDAAAPEGWWDGTPYQRILLDAPCSASGVIRRHPEIRHLRQSDDVAAAVTLQHRLLRRLWPLLDAGGILVYATCSIFRDENSHQIRGFLADCPDARERPIDSGWGRPEPVGRQILPGDDDMDGFYYAVLEKRMA